MAWFVDTNIFLRLATRDNTDRADACARLFDACRQGRIDLATSEVILAEIVYVLTSPRQYRLPRSAAADFVERVLELPRLHIPERHTVHSAVQLYRETRLDFEDCLATAHVRSRKLEGIYSYDHGFDAVESLVRREPGDASTPR